MIAAGVKVLGLIGLGLVGLVVASGDKKEKSISGPAPGGGQLMKNMLCQAPNGVVVVCHDMQPYIIAQLQTQYASQPAQRWDVPTAEVVTISSQPLPGGMLSAWMAAKLTQGKIILIACDGLRQEVIACNPGDEIKLCPLNPLQNAVLIDSPPGAAPPGPYSPPPGGGGAPPGLPGQVPPPPGPGGTPPPQYGNPPQAPPGAAPPAWWPAGVPYAPGYMGSPTPPPGWPTFLPWFGGGAQPPPQQQPGPGPAPQPQPQPGPGPQGNAAPPPWWPPSIPYPGIPGLGGGTSPTPTPSTPPAGAVVYMGPDGLYRHVIREGSQDYGAALSQWYTGNVYHTRELEKTNPDLQVVFKEGQFWGYKPWMPGQILVLPQGWNGAKGPPPVAYSQQAAPPPGVNSAPTLMSKKLAQRGLTPPLPQRRR